MSNWRVTVNESDGLGGSKPVKYRFADYQDAHAFWAYIESLSGTPFYPWCSSPPIQDKGAKIYSKGEWPAHWSKKGAAP